MLICFYILTMNILTLFQNNFVVVILLLTSILKEGYCLFCFQCTSTETMTCGEYLAPDHTLKPTNCSYLQEPQYCVKMTNLYNGEQGTKRFCSARDFGNECNMVRRPGDNRLFRACTFTCKGDYCNSGDRFNSSFWLISFIGFFFNFFA